MAAASCWVESFLVACTTRTFTGSLLIARWMAGQCRAGTGGGTGGGAGEEAAGGPAMLAGPEGFGSQESHRGRYQLRSPSTAMTEGSSTPRTTVASSQLIARSLSPDPKDPLPAQLRVCRLEGIARAYSIAVWPGLWAASEEITYLGYALPHLERRLATSLASLLTVVAWAAQHAVIPSLPGWRYRWTRVVTMLPVSRRSSSSTSPAADGLARDHRALGQRHHLRDPRGDNATSITASVTPMSDRTGRQRIDDDQVQLAGAGRGPPVDSGAGRPEHDLSCLRVYQPLVFVVGLAGQHAGDLLQSDAAAGS